MQRIVDRSDAKPGYAPASAQAGRRQRRAGIHWMRTGWSRLPQAVARLLYGKDAHRCVYFWLRLECVSKIPNMHFRRLSLPFIVDFP